ncbi:HelD family protein [Streptosporangium sandarakinum]
MEIRQRDSALAAALRTEQAHVTRAYERLDAVRRHIRAALEEAYGRETGGLHQARYEREVTAGEHARRLARLEAVEHGLCFGRIDDADGDTRYIGRAGLRDADGEIVLTDWRAPAARPFYTATPGDPGTLVRRRHLHTRDRVVVGLDDEVFDLERLAEGERRALVGEAALLAALRRGRTGRMGEVVATIQREQDRVIRSGLAGALVVQGGPGTGKTVAALHRAAFLLYTHRDVLERRGVLIVGPNATFSRYIGRVLPSLGETDVVLSSVGQLYPGVHAVAADSPIAAALKGDLDMARVLATALRDRRRVPDGDLEVDVPVRTSLRDGVEVVVRWMTLRAGHDDCVRAHDRAAHARLPHNAARKLFVMDMLRALALDEARRLDAPETEEDLRHARRALWAHEQVRRALDALWPPLTPEELVAGLLSDPAALESAAPGLTPAERAALLRPYDAPWTTGDVPLLDEVAELLGEDIGDAEAAGTFSRAERERAEREADERYALGVLEYTGLFEDDMMEAAALADRHRAPDPETTTAERAAADRRWAYGHVIVDEAQELSAMAWRTVMRRVPARSLTIVGDLAQTGSPAGARSWDEMLDPYLEGRRRTEHLLVNYRTPAEIMEVAADVLAAVAPGSQPPESVRDGGAPPRAVRLDPGLPGGRAALTALVRDEFAAIGEGRLAVIVPDARHEALTALFPRDGDVLDSPVAVLTVTAAKGLEFDAVVVVEPGEILAQSPMGGNDLYVAMTRATRRLAVTCRGELPPMLSRLRL